MRRGNSSIDVTTRTSPIGQLGMLGDAWRSGLRTYKATSPNATGHSFTQRLLSDCSNIDAKVLNPCLYPDHSCFCWNRLHNVYKCDMCWRFSNKQLTVYLPG